MSSLRILSIDIGGTLLKATVLNQFGEEIMPYKSVKTPKPSSPENVTREIVALVKGLKGFDCVSVGFPGYVRDGVIQTAPNLGTAVWHKVDLEHLLSDMLKKPARVVNDADLLGLGIASGEGFEILITLGTGFGTAFLKNGILFPHIELAHHPIIKNTDYDQYVGDKTMKSIGVEKWNKRMQEVLKILKVVFNYDRLYIGGGNARFINFKLPENVTVVSNEQGIKGGANLWNRMRSSADSVIE